MTTLQHILDSLLFAGVGIIVFIFSFILVDKITPYNLWREIVEHKNTALAILAAAFLIGLAIIVSSAIHG